MIKKTYKTLFALKFQNILILVFKVAAEYLTKSINVQLH